MKRAWLWQAVLIFAGGLLASCIVGLKVCKSGEWAYWCASAVLVLAVAALVSCIVGAKGSPPKHTWLRLGVALVPVAILACLIVCLKACT